MYFKDIYTLYKYKKICIRDYISHLKTAVTYYSSVGNIFFQKKNSYTCSYKFLTGFNS